MGNIVVTCKSCGTQFEGRYCNNCGEKKYESHDRSLIHFFEEGLHFITHFEGTLFTTLKTMFTRPGKLSYDYCDGVRKKYFKPLSFFLLLIVLYLLFPVFEGLNMKMQYHINQSLYGDFALHKIQEKLAYTGYTETVLAEKFHVKGEKVSKFMLIVIIPLTALFFYACSFFKRKYFFDQMVFAAEINSFFLLWGFLLLPLLTTIINSVAHLLTGRYIPFYDGVLGIMIYTVMCIYVAKAAKTFYGFKWWQAIVFTVLFYFAHTFIVYNLYKFLLFVTVINQIH